MDLTELQNKKEQIINILSELNKNRNEVLTQKEAIREKLHSTKKASSAKEWRNLLEYGNYMLIRTDFEIARVEELLSLTETAIEKAEGLPENPVDDFNVGI